MPSNRSTAPVAVLDHITVYVSSLDKSAEFYSTVLGLREIPCPLVHRPIRWFSLGKGLSIHIIEGITEQPNMDINHHIALQTDDFDAFLAHMHNCGIEYCDSKGKPGKVHQRRDGHRQIFFKDPDGYWLEVNDVEIE